MGLKETIEAVKELETDSGIAQWFSNRWDPADISTDDLRELAEAYERLLEAARDMYDDLAFQYQKDEYLQIIGESYPRPVELPSAPSGGVLGERES